MRFSNLQAWLQWQETLHPNTIDLGLERVQQVYRRLPAAVSDYALITVAGTNGKGSSVAMLEAIYLAAGYRVAAYTSPHLLHYNERIRLMGQPVDDARLCESFARVDDARGDTSLTYFEFGTLAALEIFSATPLDVVILEVGLGGRLDATNIIDADVALITNVGLDHMQWLGESIDRIAAEKAGIIKPGRPVVYGGRQIPTPILDLAAQQGSPCYAHGRDYRFEQAGAHWHWYGPSLSLQDLSMPSLQGAFQLDNAAGVLMVQQLLQDRLPVAAVQINAALASLQLAGRFSVIPGEITTILDVAHNPMGMECLCSLLETQAIAGATHAVVAFMGDKDIAGMVASLSPWVQYWYPAALTDTRGARCEQLQQIFSRLSLPEVPCYERPLLAWQAARAQARPGDRILVTGSFVTVAEIMAKIS